ncbi:MAG: NUDIX hydrolase [Chloroflexi bacterium]|nr:NUDIX hydrolase [Chloroflexota bacterium]
MRDTRCQGVVMRDGRLLLVRHTNHRTGVEYWWLPGGGLEAGESREACVARELHEETRLTVSVERLLFEIEDASRAYQYRAYATYLCTTQSGEAVAGHEAENSATHTIDALGWYPLYDEEAWEPGFYEPHIYPLLKAVQDALR